MSCDQLVTGREFRRKSVTRVSRRIRSKNVAATIVCGDHRDHGHCGLNSKLHPPYTPASPDRCPLSRNHAHITTIADRSCPTCYVCLACAQRTRAVVHAQICILGDLAKTFELILNHHIPGQKKHTDTANFWFSKETFFITKQRFRYYLELYRKGS